VAKTGSDVETAYFATTEDRKFGMSLDRWVSKPPGAALGVRALEIKTMVSSSTLFKAMVDGDVSEYRDQCLFGLWHFTLDWMDLGLWCPDLQFLHIVRIERDEDEIQALEDDMLAFDRLVGEYEAKLLKAMGRAPAAEPPPWEEPKAPAPAPAAPTTKAAAKLPAAADF
jgi:exodeoxyribonuclease (lambda-induced)